MARRANRIYVPLDANFFDDDKIVTAGEPAGWLFLNMCAKAKQLDTDGVLSRAQVERLAVKGWQKRLDQLIAVEAVVEHDGQIGICGWLNWNDSVEDRAQKRKADRDRKAGRTGGGTE